MIRFKLIDQFRSFYFRNYPDDMEQLIEYFAVFGGLGWNVDVSKPIEVLIQELILENYELIYEKMEELTLGESNNKRLLSALAVGNRGIFSSFNRAGLNNGNGGAALNYLQEKGLVQIEYSREESPKTSNPHAKLKREEARRRVSHKVLFTQPFVRFWFYFIARYTKDIKAKNYTNLMKNFQERRNSYTSLVFEELSEVLLNYHLRDAQIVSSGSYWDANVEIDILTVTHDERVYVGECKWTNHKVNKSELKKILDKCERLDIKPTQIALFSKRGFSKELLSMQGKDLALYSAEEFKALIKKSTKHQLIEAFILN
ncbi:MAG: DUF234 domain-containing protein [Epsilonproteobacteria bacterium]|nr:DUF234 domain-containing protein [Campylobacterota bacterium]OIO14982.1 MAG: ATPase [Helicobacteraceae bacterium CG1_02_36_14]PIP10561.1 MAG: ATPase [Sulfurimonas sp. CG23_combo_of_CG06-09_8_20_14_all_36_33]PIS27011.1 MAG: ATPase [Sulfurimonas sp. CG08_land_8_20_14_0_20_36_33]PIU35905.1 MAG: ATPase [Sulfurimonas sp. CG07_land_8_20_14_0_80_36_56]PIV03482.1 MAG: ATPase [Sulfurimonas sp. CG03_land_8_20_14_0_80_36_25]PIV35428.1 MAG: ATPase [Sulfurimonas sp. CG02_land_8_20_14_3_00_36_67]PIV596